MTKRMRCVWCAYNCTPTVDLEKSGYRAFSAKVGRMKNVREHSHARIVIQMILTMHISITAYCFDCNMYNNFVNK